ncbi:tyrosine-type recombinase/integrase [Massilia sp. DD77]|uniref:tyrosine-type recombinase/integrase n=1 Tax=Massilia sp. DD77 TaxID=3109349 RepID=UPI0030008E8C
MHPVQPFQQFLIWKLLGRGVQLSSITWEDYGRRLWDFARFLHANGLAWNEPVYELGKSVVARYRDWSVSELTLSAKTVNGRLRLIVDFYEWAHTRELIDRLPFDYADVRVPQFDRLLMHVDEGERTVGRPNIMLREWTAMPEFLTSDQIRIVRALPLSPTRRLLFELMVRVGLRSVEARTFPLRYVFNPATRRDCAPDRMIRLRLDPRHIHTKFGKARDVDVPYSLMSDLYSYTLYERNRLVNGASQQHRASLLLTTHGMSFSKDAVAETFRTVSALAGFRVTALMLRHTYAIYTLARLRANPDYTGEPLLYLRDRLGHENVQTTAVYLAQIEQLAGATVLSIADEYEVLFA